MSIRPLFPESFDARREFRGHHGRSARKQVWPPKSYSFITSTDPRSRHPSPFACCCVFHNFIGPLQHLIHQHRVRISARVSRAIGPAAPR